jgi:hypothetical protein
VQSKLYAIGLTRPLVAPHQTQLNIRLWVTTRQDLRADCAHLAVFRGAMLSASSQAASVAVGCASTVTEAIWHALRDYERDVLTAAELASPSPATDAEAATRFRP